MALGFTSGKGERILPYDQVQARFGSRLLPQLVDELARSSPDRIYASIPRSSDLSQGFRVVTILELAQAVNHFAWWRDGQIGESTTFGTLAYIGISDIRYAVVFLAAVKCGYKLLLPSLRNATSTTISLLEQTQCSKILYSAEMAQKIRDLQAGMMDLQIFHVPAIDDIYNGNAKYYPYEETFADARWNPLVILQSSSSTGPPKPIEMNHGTFAVLDNDRNLPLVDGRKNISFAVWNFTGSDGRYFSSFPPFHLGGFYTLLVIPIFSTAATIVLGPTDRLSTGQIASQIMHCFPIRALFCLPSIFEQIVQGPEGLQKAKELDFLLYAGGPLSTTTGNLLSQLTDVFQFYGTTETGAIPTLVPHARTGQA